MKKFSFQTRSENLTKAKDQDYDLLIIGGGINGAGVARDAAMRGMRVVLVEADDFASGTSSRSSKLIHGGIRYLENLEFKLVFEALSERQKLFEMAPHLVHPLRFTIPLFNGGRFGMFELGLGMFLYDALSLFEAPEAFERLSADEALRCFPNMKKNGLLGAYTYSDAYMDDDRLVYETLRSANEFGAISMNYVKARAKKTKKLNSEDFHFVECEDLLSNSKFEIKAKHIVSAVGPWTDQLGKDFDIKWNKILRPTKGVHLTFQKQRLPLQNAVVMAAEKRIVFAIPRHEMVIIGTTDTDYTGSPGQVSTDAEDVKYLISVAKEYFPGSNLSEKDIVASYAGVRPLVKDESENEGKTSREHSIFSNDSGVTFVAGGKYTTYRLIAEQTVEEVLKKFSLEERIKFRKQNTAQALNPMITLETQQQKEVWSLEIKKITGWNIEESNKFFDRHGFESFEIINKYGKYLQPIELEIWHAIENTMCLNLVDFYTRRLPLFLSDPQHGLQYLKIVSGIFGKYFSWSEKQTMSEEIKLQEYVRKELSWRDALEIS